MLTDEQSTPRFAESWSPRIGDRVVVRLSGECPRHSKAGCAYADGEVGIIEDDIRAPTRYCMTPGREADAAEAFALGHWWIVVFQGRSFRHSAGFTVNADELCTAEMEPIDEEVPPC